MAYAPACTLEIAANKSGFVNPPRSAGGTVLDVTSSTISALGAAGTGDTTAATELQGPAVQRAPYQEVNLFVGEFCRLYGAAGNVMTPQAAIVAIQQILQTMRTQFYNA